MDTVVVRVTSSDTTVVKPTHFVRIRRQYYISAQAWPGRTHVHRLGRAGAGIGATNGTVTGPSLLFSNTSAMYGMRQRSSASDYYVYTQNNVASATTVNW